MNFEKLVLVNSFLYLFKLNLTLYILKRLSLLAIFRQTRRLIY